jgi:hypothetical protein
MSTNNEILYRIFKDDAERSGMDMKDFYHKRRKGLYPFRDSNGYVEWLKKSEFRIMSAKKRSKNKKVQKHKNKHKHTNSNPFFTTEMITVFLFLGIGILIFFIIIKLVQLFLSFF